MRPLIFTPKADYTYSDQWVEHLVAEVNDDQKFADLKAFEI